MKEPSGGYDSGKAASEERELRLKKEFSQHRNAQAARKRMIRKMTDRENNKVKPESGTERIPIWSKF